VEDVVVSNIIKREMSAKALHTGMMANARMLSRVATEIQGYHLVNRAPIKEARWEDINESILRPFHTITGVAKGDHTSGKDMVCDGYGISNKSAMVNKKGMIAVSSYRLTKVCSSKTPGCTKAI
jgi:hypothetical protein